MSRNGVPGTDYPEERAVVDLLVTGRGDRLTSFVEQVEDQDLVLSAGQDRSQRRVRLDSGAGIELIWRGSPDFRTMPAQFIAVEGSDHGRWRIRPTGPAVRGQRRAAVRAPLSLPLTATAGGTTLVGVSVDVSEGGFRALLRPAAKTDGPGADPSSTSGWEVGQALDVVVDLESGQVTAKAEVIRRHRREDDNEEFSGRFVGLTERQQDHLRAHVFAGLRDLRRKGVL